MTNLLGRAHDCYIVMSGLKGKPADWQLVQRRYSRCVAAAAVHFCLKFIEIEGPQGLDRRGRINLKFIEIEGPQGLDPRGRINLSDRWIGIVCAWCKRMYCDTRGYRCDCYRPRFDRWLHVRHPAHDPLRELSL